MTKQTTIQRVAIILLFVPALALAGKLDNFESGLASGTGGPPAACDSRSCLGADIFGEVMFQMVASSIAYGGASSLARMMPASWDFPEDECPPRLIGEHLIPLTRLDVSYQEVESDVDAMDYRVELGYGPVGVHVNHTRYHEARPADGLDLIRVHGLYRMSFGPYVEVDLGFGALTIDGNSRDTRVSFAMPVHIRPFGPLAIELRPVWSGDVTDIDLGVLFGWRYMSLKAGYRWVRGASESLDGVYGGLSFHL